MLDWQDDVKEDFRNSGKQSTLGSASFYDKIQNMPVVQANKKAKVGRRKIVRTSHVSLRLLTPVPYIGISRSVLVKVDDHV